MRELFDALPVQRSGKAIAAGFTGGDVDRYRRDAQTFFGEEHSHPSRAGRERCVEEFHDGRSRAAGVASRKSRSSIDSPGIT